LYWRSIIEAGVFVKGLDGGIITFECINCTISIEMGVIISSWVDDAFLEEVR
jgi:hypothetical protein